MTYPEPHSREWYALQARERGGYNHPWKRTLDGPEPETTFTSVLESLLRPETRVLEAGCGHGPDAARYASRNFWCWHGGTSQWQISASGTDVYPFLSP